MASKQVNVRVSDEEKEVIQKLADKQGMSQAEAIVDAVKRRYQEVTVQPLIDETYRLYGELRLATQEIELQYIHECEKLLEDIFEQAKKRSLPYIAKKADELLGQIDDKLAVL